MNDVLERIGKHVAITREFQFVYLPAFARFIREHHLEEYVESVVATSKEMDLPMLKHLSHLTDEQMVEMRRESHSEFLLAAEENTLGHKLVVDLDRWFCDKLELLKREDIAAEDITLGTYIRKRTLAEFLPLYTHDCKLITAIIGEIDQYGVAVDTAAMNVYLDILHDTIDDELAKSAAATKRLRQSEALLKKAQEISNVGHWTWDLATGKIEWSDNLYKIYGLPVGTELDFDEIIGFNEPGEQKKIKEELKQSIMALEPREAYYHIVLKDGTKKILHGKTDPLPDENGLAIRVEGVIQDVTEREKLVERLQHSEKLFKQAEAISRMGNWWWNIAEETIEWSDEVYRIYGVEPGELSPNDILGKRVHPEDIERVTETVRRAKENKEPYDMEYRIVDLKGQDKVLRTKADVEVVDGEPVSIYGTVQDITAQKLAERTVNEYRDFIQKITNVTPSLITTYNLKKGKYTFVNETFERVLKYPVKQAMDEGFSFVSTIMHPDDLESIGGTLEAALAAANQLPPGGDELVVEYKFRLRSAAGPYIWFHSYSTVFERDEHGKVESIVSVSVNITGQEEAELSLARKNVELEKSNKSLEEYAYVSSHDLKEPLRKIATLTDRLRILLNRGQVEDSNVYMERIIGAAKKMTAMVDDLLAVATIAGNKTFELCDLNEVLNDALSSLDQVIEETGAIIDADHLPKAKVVRSQFRQLFQNLISNSLKFSLPGVSPQIKIRALLSDGETMEQIPAVKSPEYLQLSVADSGIGFEEEYADNLFAMFKRLHGKHEYEGTGIGLAICKKIAENHNGIIYAHGEPNKGATFTIVIPQY